MRSVSLLKGVRAVCRCQSVTLGALFHQFKGMPHVESQQSICKKACRESKAYPQAASCYARHRGAADKCAAQFSENDEKTSDAASKENRCPRSRGGQRRSGNRSADAELVAVERLAPSTSYPGIPDVDDDVREEMTTARRPHLRGGSAYAWREQNTAIQKHNLHCLTGWSRSTRCGNNGGRHTLDDY
jgi:hypothetical protein